MKIGTLTNLMLILVIIVLSGCSKKETPVKSSDQSVDSTTDTTQQVQPIDDMESREVKVVTEELPKSTSPSDKSDTVTNTQPAADNGQDNVQSEKRSGNDDITQQVNDNLPQNNSDADINVAEKNMDDSQSEQPEAIKPKALKSITDQPADTTTAEGMAKEALENFGNTESIDDIRDRVKDSIPNLSN